MKKTIWIFLLLFVSMIGSTQTVIDLKGKLKQRPIKNQNQPLEVLLSDNEIRVNFFDCLNNLTVTVEDENGLTVYKETVNSCVTGSISIDIQNLPSGWYKITISDQYGGYLEGWFFIE